MTPSRLAINAACAYFREEGTRRALGKREAAVLRLLNLARASSASGLKPQGEMSPIGADLRIPTGKLTGTWKLRLAAGHASRVAKSGTVDGSGATTNFRALLESNPTATDGIRERQGAAYGPRQSENRACQRSLATTKKSGEQTRTQVKSRVLSLSAANSGLR